MQEDTKKKMRKREKWKYENVRRRNIDKLWKREG